METLGERNEVSVPVPTENNKMTKKKKVIRVVKKIVKKKVIKKVPKPKPESKTECLLGASSSNCDSFGSNDVSAVMDIENDDSSRCDRIQVAGVKKEVEKGVCLVEKNGDQDRIEPKIEKRNVVAEKLSEFENVKDVEVRLVERNDCDKDESEINGLVSAYLVSDPNGVELQISDKERAISSNLTGNDAMEIEKRNVVDKKMSEFENVKDIDASLCGKNGLSVDENEISGLVASYLVSDKNGVELQDGDNNGIELQISDQNRVEDNDAMDVKGQESEVGVKEVVVNNETEGTGLQQGLSGVASWWQKKQRRKIFVHGFDKETKEDDVRKVFEKIGEVVEVKLITNFNSGKSRGFGFVRYASADLAELALTKFRHVEIRGSTWHTAAVEDSDTIALNNIDKKWNNENVLSLLQKVGITEIDEVSVVPDPENSELNLGFAFIEFETKRDAQMAYRKLQIKNVFGEYSKIKVVWAESLADLVEEEMHNVKSVFAEYVPSSWDEKEVKDHFKLFGEIESIALAKNLHSAKRNDFAFINYKTCQAALSCVEALNDKRSSSENGPKAHLKVSLAKSIPKGKPVKIKSESAVTEASKVNQLSNQSRPSHVRYQNASQTRPFHSPYQNASQSRPSHSPYQNASQSRPSHSPYQNVSVSRPSHNSPYQNAIQSRPSHSRYQNEDQLRPSQGISGVYQPQMAIRSEVPSIVRHEASRKDEGSSTTNELVQLLREQASWKLGGASSTAGISTGHPQSQFGGKQLQLPTDLTQGRNASYSDPRSYHQTHLQMPNLTQRRPIVASPHYDQQHAHYTHGYNVVEPNPSYIQKRNQATYPGNGSSFYR